MAVSSVAAIVFSVVAAGAAAFQLGLALGLPWGSYAMGGRFPGRFPPAMRVGAFGQGVLLSLMALVLLSRVRLAPSQWSAASGWLTWAVFAFSLVSLVLNAISPSAGERRIWVPVALVMAVTSLAVAIGPV